VTGQYAGNVIVKFDPNNGTYIEHYHDRDLKSPQAMLYDNQVLYVTAGNAVRTYDAETGEFLEIFVSHAGMDCTAITIHSM
jgi:hypothetical protein